MRTCPYWERHFSQIQRKCKQQISRHVFIFPNCISNPQNCLFRLWGYFYFYFRFGIRGMLVNRRRDVSRGSSLSIWRGWWWGRWWGLWCKGKGKGGGAIPKYIYTKVWHSLLCDPLRILAAYPRIKWKKLTRGWHFYVISTKVYCDFCSQNTCNIYFCIYTLYSTNIVCIPCRAGV